MITNKKELRLYLEEDMKQYFPKYWRYCAYLLYGFEQAYILRYLRLLRKCEYHYNRNHKLRFHYYNIMRQHLALRLHIEIPLNVCGYGLRLRHLSGGGGILLNAKRIGNYCSFNSGVLLGNKDDGFSKPILGDRVSFGPSAKAFGDIVIGNDVFVAPNGVVTKDVEANSIVGGVPAKFIKYKLEITPHNIKSSIPSD